MYSVLSKNGMDLVTVLSKNGMDLVTVFLRSQLVTALGHGR
jgi:hypothetical protein